MASSKQNLDYNITYPDRVTEEMQIIGENEVKRSKNVPVVIFLGWAGCEEKHLMKYKMVYEKRCITMSYISPLPDIFFRPQNMKLAAEKLFQFLTENEVQENPIVFHAFSNGGGMMYWQMIELLHEEDRFKEFNIIGTIFDSLPAQRKLSTAVKALPASLNVNFVIKLFITFCILCLMLVMYLFEKLTKPSHVSTTNDRYWEFMESESSKWPSLYLYSKCDEIINYLDVEKVISKRKNLGANIQSVCWDDSPHVQHFRYHRESYVTHCHQFIDHCLKTVE